MQRNLNLLLLLFITISTNAQNVTPSLNLGDPAPPLRVHQWIKGTPVTQFKKGHVYVLEFWATWCKPCIAAMPHLSALAREYKDKVTFIGMDIYEGEIKYPKSISQVRAFVDSMGSRMDYTVATEDGSYTVRDWIEATGEKGNGIPRTFVVNSDGKLAWIGHPTELDEPLHKIVNNSWNVNKALVERNEYRRLEELEASVREQLNGYVGDRSNPYDLGKPDSALLFIDQLVKKEPKLKYAPTVAFHTFSSLIKTDLKKAYLYGKEVLATPSYCGIESTSITGPIDWAEKTSLVTLPLQIYELGADAFQFEIEQNKPSNARLFQIHMKMVDWYWRAKNNEKAIEAAQKAIEVMKSEKTPDSLGLN